MRSLFVLHLFRDRHVNFLPTGLEERAYETCIIHALTAVSDLNATQKEKAPDNLFGLRKKIFNAAKENDGYPMKRRRFGVCFRSSLLPSLNDCSKPAALKSGCLQTHTIAGCKSSA